MYTLHGRHSKYSRKKRGAPPHRPSRVDTTDTAYTRHAAPHGNRTRDHIITPSPPIPLITTALHRAALIFLCASPSVYLQSFYCHAPNVNVYNQRARSPGNNDNLQTPSLVRCSWRPVPHAAHEAAHTNTLTYMKHTMKSNIPHHSRTSSKKSPYTAPTASSAKTVTQIDLPTTSCTLLTALLTIRPWKLIQRLFSRYLLNTMSDQT